MRLAQHFKNRKIQPVGLVLLACLFLLSACSSVATPTAQPVVPAPTTPVVAPISTTPATNLEPALAPKPGFYRLNYADSEYFIHLPANLPSGQPLQVVLAIHGMNNNGMAFGQPLIEYSDKYGFVLVAPTMKYDANYTDPGHIASNDKMLLPELHGLISDLSTQLNYPINEKVMLFGFSRGGQIVHRYAMFYPQDVLGVAAMSAGNYTLPAQEYRATTNANKVALRFPFGTADMTSYAGHQLDLAALRRVSFWLGVGGADNAIKDVPEAWNPYLGQTRIERASRYYQALQAAGVKASLKVFPGVGHDVCTEMKQGAFAFFNNLMV